MNTSLSQGEADTLLKMEKFATTKDIYKFPDYGGNISVPLASRDGREQFSLDISRKRIALTTKYQMRARQAIVLARLDFGSPHRNPDDEEIGVPHLHLYREGFADRWAYNIPAGMLSKPDDAWQVLLDFMSFCTVVVRPNIERGLFHDLNRNS